MALHQLPYKTLCISRYRILTTVAIPDFQNLQIVFRPCRVDLQFLAIRVASHNFTNAHIQAWDQNEGPTRATGQQIRPRRVLLLTSNPHISPYKVKFWCVFQILNPWVPPNVNIWGFITSVQMGNGMGSHKNQLCLLCWALILQFSRKTYPGAMVLYGETVRTGVHVPASGTIYGIITGHSIRQLSVENDNKKDVVVGIVLVFKYFCCCPVGSWLCVGQLSIPRHQQNITFIRFSTVTISNVNKNKMDKIKILFSQVRCSCLLVQNN